MTGLKALCLAAERVFQIVALVWVVTGLGLGVKV